jgi:hypothetical protein
VIALLGIGEGARQTVMDQMAIFGINRLYINPGGENPRGPGGASQDRWCRLALASDICKVT